MKNYRERIADRILLRKLEGKGAVLLEGAKWCGKTTTAEQVAGSVLYMSDPDIVKQNLELAELNPKLLLSGKTPRLIDEWQLAPKLWDAVRFEVDHRKELGQFILTGSSVPPSREGIFHSGTGRFARLKMRTMSLFESGDSSGEVSVGSLFGGGTEVSGSNSATAERLAFLVCRGGWPMAVDMRDKLALDQAFDYCDAVINSDMSRYGNVYRDAGRVGRLMRAYARHQGMQVSNATLKSDIAANDNASLNEDTIYSYVNALREMFVVEELPAWNPNLRSKTAVRTSETRYFVDPSIATAVLGISPDDLMGDLKSFGLFFETLCVRDLRIFAEALDGKLYHYRDASGLECDAVIHLRNGSYGLVEIKLGGDRAIEEGVVSLNKLAKKLDTTKMREPSFMMVLTGVGKYAYRRKDGILIVPIGCLRD